MPLQNNKKKKKKKAGGGGGQHAASSNPEIEEELMALESIYAEEFEADSDRRGFTCMIVPHPGDMEENFTSAELHVRYPATYPMHPLILKLTASEGLDVALIKRLMHALNDMAALHANANEVCAFNVVGRVQEFLREHNKKPEDSADKIPQSMWHQWQQRLKADGAGDPSAAGSSTHPLAPGYLPSQHPTGSSDASSSLSAIPPQYRQAIDPIDWSETVGNGLFADDDDFIFGSLPQMMSTADTKELPSRSQGKAGRGAHLPLLEAAATSVPSVPSLQSADLPFPLDHEDEREESQALGTGGPSYRSEEEKEFEVSPEGTGKNLREDTCPKGQQIRTAVKTGMFREPSNTESEDEDDDEESSADSDIEAMGEQSSLSAATGGSKMQFLIGHLLMLATARGDRKQLADGLKRTGVLPPWLHSLVTEPGGATRLSKAMEKLFANEIAAARSSPHKQLLSNFWDLQQGDTTLHSHQRGAIGQPDILTIPLSRYKTDFDEIERLGKGGYGVVAAAINRLDGCKYAIKKIHLAVTQARSPHSYARIMREVATLSNLQHPNVVRYFQAWCEDSRGDDGDEGDESEDEWGDLSSSQGPSLLDSPSCQTNSFSIPPHLSRGDRSRRLMTVRESQGTDTSSSDALGLFDRGGDLRVDSESESPSNTEEEVERSHRSKPEKSPQLLYIQMEFCPRTLQQVLEKPIKEEDAWQILRGILSGLAYIHAQGVIHRDLKPANIFFGASLGEVKLGDFGLAKFNNPQDRSSGGVVVSPTTSPPSCPVTNPQPSYKRPSVCAPSSESHRAAHSMPAGSEHTGVCGTSFYISPEIANGWASYDAKVDLFSLGVIVFEIWHPFETAMERAVMLNSLRDTGAMPEKWAKEHEKVASLIKWLMSANPADRPTAREVLRGDVLPPLVEDAQLNDLLRSLPDNSETYERVVDSIFNMATTAASAIKQPAAAGRSPVTWAGTASMGSHVDHVTTSASRLPGGPVSAPSVFAQDAVIRNVRKVFDCHGAVPMATNALDLAPQRSHLLSSAAVKALLPSGSLLAFRHEMRVPFAAWVSQTAASPASTGGHVSWDSMRRYTVAPITAMVRGRSLPAVFMQADLDIITPSHLTLPEQNLSLAEAITCIAQILDLMPDLGPYEIRINHRMLLDLTLASIGLPKDVRQSAVKLFDEAAKFSCLPRLHPQQAAMTTSVGGDRGGNMSGSASSSSDVVTGGRHRLWAAIQAGLRDLGVTPEGIRRCKQGLLHVPGEVFSSIDKMRSFSREVVGANAHMQAIASAALDELQALARHLTLWGVSSSSIVLEPLLLHPGTDYYSNVIFEVYIATPGGQAVQVAMGGRYDSLLRALWTPAASSVGGPPPGAVGLSVNVERLARMIDQIRLHQPQQQQQTVVRPSQAEVLICSRGSGGSLEARMSLLSACWAVGLKAEIVPRVCPNVSEQYEYANARGIRWLVTIEEGKSNLVKVKNLDRKVGEESLMLPDVPRYLLTALSRGGPAGGTVGRLGMTLGVGTAQTSFSPQLSLRGGVEPTPASTSLASGLGASKDPHATSGRDTEGDGSEKADGRDGSRARGGRYNRERGKYLFNHNAEH